jgi:Protein of unknown function (DUF2946)
MKIKAHSSIIHWIAIFAILMSALAPSISQALAINDPSKSFDSEICSVTGSKLIHIVSADDQSKDHQFFAEHCPYCAVQPHYLPPLKSDLNFYLSQGNTFFPQIYYQSPKPLFSWLTLPSRAPPSNS